MIHIARIYGQAYLIPTIKITYDNNLNGSKEIILCFAKWEIILKSWT